MRAPACPRGRSTRRAAPLRVPGTKGSSRSSRARCSPARLRCRSRCIASSSKGTPSSSLRPRRASPRLSPAPDDCRFLKACRAEPTDVTPVWFMRQAGGYLPEYRALRQKHSLLELCHHPELAAQVTLQPVERLGVDAAILFADILLPFEPLGLERQQDVGEQ